MPTLVQLFALLGAALAVLSTLPGCFLDATATGPPWSPTDPGFWGCFETPDSETPEPVPGRIVITQEDGDLLEGTGDGLFGEVDWWFTGEVTGPGTATLDFGIGPDWISGIEATLEAGDETTPATLTLVIWGEARELTACPVEE